MSENETAITTIERDCIGDLSTLSHDEVLRVWDRVQFYAREIKRVKEVVEAEVLQWVQANGDLVVSDTLRYYAGTEKKTTCVDTLATVEAVLDATGGDLKAFCDVLSSGAIKHGAARAILPPEKFERLFRVEETASLEEGKPKKKLMKADATFVRPKRLSNPSGAAASGGTAGPASHAQNTAVDAAADTRLKADQPSAPTNPQPGPTPGVVPSTAAGATPNAPAAKGRPKARETVQQAAVVGASSPAGNVPEINDTAPPAAVEPLEKL